MKTIRVNHSDLVSSDSWSMYRVMCPECEKGIITMRRNYHTLRLLNWDICPSCSIKIIFKDIRTLISKEQIYEKEGRRRTRNA